MKISSAADVLLGLKDFQRNTVEYVYNQLYHGGADRFLIADEVGLGKTLVARGIIAKVVEALYGKGRVDVLYICSNAEIARQNIRRLNVTDSRFAQATRVTLMPLQLKEISGNDLNFISFTPGTSFDLRSNGGVARERLLLYRILRDHWGFGERAGPKNLFQQGVGRANWRNKIRQFNGDAIDEELTAEFLHLLDKDPSIRCRFERLCDWYGHARAKYPQEYVRESLAFIGDLRRLLAKVCIYALDPNLVIMDEFQRFRHLLDGDDEVAELATHLFEYPNVKVLLLSATPYKMYTVNSDASEDEHYTDFIRTVSFLLNNPQNVQTFQRDLQAFRHEFYALAQDGGNKLRAAKNRVEDTLRQVMVRTERLAVDSSRGGMLTSLQPTVGQVKPSDLQDYALVDTIARIVGAQDMAEYWKSTPYALNVMDRNYRVKQKLVEAIDSDTCQGELLQTLGTLANTQLTRKRIRNYGLVDPNNARLRMLMRNTVESGWELLWVPPSLPYYSTSGIYSKHEKRGLSKALVFSSWQVVPKVIAMMLSYEAERRVTALRDDLQQDYFTDSQRTTSPLDFS